MACPDPKPRRLTAERKGLGPNSPQARWAVREIKAILDSYGRSIHSLVLFGSYAMGNATPQSDIDFLVLLKSGEEARRLRKILFDFKMALGNESQGEIAVEMLACTFGVEFLISDLRDRKFQDSAKLALKRMGDPAIKEMIELLKAQDMRRRAWLALIEITGESFGPDYDAWMGWWKKRRKDVG